MTEDSDEQPKNFFEECSNIVEMIKQARIEVGSVKRNLFSVGLDVPAKALNETENLLAFAARYLKIRLSDKQTEDYRQSVDSSNNILRTALAVAENLEQRDNEP